MNKDLIEVKKDQSNFDRRYSNCIAEIQGNTGNLEEQAKKILSFSVGAIKAENDATKRTCMKWEKIGCLLYEHRKNVEAKKGKGSWTSWCNDNIYEPLAKMSIGKRRMEQSQKLYKYYVHYQAKKMDIQKLYSLGFDRLFLFLNTLDQIMKNDDPDDEADFRVWSEKIKNCVKDDKNRFKETVDHCQQYFHAKSKFNPLETDVKFLLFRAIESGVKANNIDEKHLHSLPGKTETIGYLHDLMYSCGSPRYAGGNCNPKYTTSIEVVWNELLELLDDAIIKGVCPEYLNPQKNNHIAELQNKLNQLYQQHSLYPQLAASA